MVSIKSLKTRLLAACPSPLAAPAHLAYVATAYKLERWNVVLIVLGAFVLWRALIIALAWTRPLENFVIHDPRHLPQ